MSHVLAIELTQNSKTGPCSATYVSQHSCPRGCPFLNCGCYAEYGPLSIITRKVKGDETAAEQMAREEARAIDSLSGRRDLRLHVVGDCRTNNAAKIVSRAAQRFVRKWGKSIWTYTHAWREVKRSSWQGVSVLASCEQLRQIKEARARGYATALVVEEFLSEKTYALGSEKILPCPAQTRGITCVGCRLCFDDQRLSRAGLTVGFELHGAGRRRALPLLGS